MMNGPKRIGWTVCAAVAAAIALAGGCSIYRNDRTWIPEEQYALAHAMYLQTGSLDLVARQLEDLQWRRGRINETVYRLKKEFEVLPEELPPAMPAPAAATPAAPVTSGTTTLTVPTLPPPPPPPPAP